MSRAHRSARIVATLGPASRDEATLRRLIAAGLDVARLNMSHSSAAEHRQSARRLRRLAGAAGRPIGLLFDLQGPKLRLGTFPGPLPLEPGEALTLSTRPQDLDVERRILPVDYPALHEEVRKGLEILLADGAVRLLVEGVRGQRVRCRVVEGRALTARAGLSLPSASAVRSPLTRKDRRDLALAVECGADAIALSFVRRAADIEEARRLVKRRGGTQQLVAKIETALAVENLDEIIAATDAVMVARGDLGVELPLEQVPVEQKRIIAAANRAGKPVITATQMLESMCEASRPTRAEASDVANAVLDGSWGVMLSAETAIGRHPALVVETMDRIVREAERHGTEPRRRRPNLTGSVTAGLAEACAWLAHDVGAVAILALTRSGTTARHAARFCAQLPIYAYTPEAAALSRMTLYRSVIPRRIPRKRSFIGAIEAAGRDLRKRGDLLPGDLVIVLGAHPREPLGVTNRLVVHRI